MILVRKNVLDVPEPLLASMLTMGLISFTKSVICIVYGGHKRGVRFLPWRDW